MHSTTAVSPAIDCAARKPACIGRRNLLAQFVGPVITSSTALRPVLSAEATSDTASKWTMVSDEILAYEFSLPLESSSGRKLSFVTTRKPERYSSAAPLSPDARQRITCEFVDFTGPITATVSVGPPSPRLKSLDRSNWTPRVIAQEVLADRSPAKSSPGQRVPASDIEKLEEREEDGTTYMVYEHVAQGSPNLIDKSAETYKRAVASTAERDGYFYTFNITAPGVYWDDVGPRLYESALSFRLLQPRRSFVPPDKQPWRFW